MQAIIITIGDEILIGQVIDSNSAWMATELNLLGISIIEINSISDNHEAIVEGIDKALQKADLVLLTGGLGPTKDDITKKAIADYFGVEQKFDEELWEKIKNIFQRLGRSTTEAHRAQCFMPVNALLLENNMGTAPGMWFEKNDKFLISMPGVPYEMKYIMEHGVLPKLKPKLDNIFIEHRTILTVGEGESRIATRLESFEEQLPAGFKLAFLPGLGKVRLRISGKSSNKGQLVSTIESLKKELVSVVSEFVYGFENEDLSQIIGNQLIERDLKLVTAESCTGGYLAHEITKIPGSSAYFMGSIVAYANEVKEQLLKVNTQTLQEHGAVSEATVKEMVRGALNVVPADLAIAISGIAGPSGGTLEKPVGTIWLAIGNKKRMKTKKICLFKDRLKNIQYASVVALNMVRLFLLEAK